MRKGTKQTEEARKKMSESLKGRKPPKSAYRKGHRNHLNWFKSNAIRVGESNNKWKGDEVGYRAIHYWVRRHKELKNYCSTCGIKKTSAKSIHLANLSHSYLRDVNDWAEMCVKCHKKYDNK